MNNKALINNVLLSISLVVSTSTFAAAEPLKIEDQLAYYYGFTIGNMLKAEGFSDIEDMPFKSGISDALSGSEPRLTKEQQQTVIEMVRLRREETRNQQIAALQMEGTNFLTANATKEGVQQTASGLQYLVLTEGTGPQPSAASTVLAHYKGELIDGQEFDSSIARGEPAEFKLSQVIAGWTEGLQLMKQGGKMRFFIPSDLGYGPGGTRNIPPHSVLVFEVELIEVRD